MCIKKGQWIPRSAGDAKSMTLIKTGAAINPDKQYQVAGSDRTWASPERLNQFRVDRLCRHEAEADWRGRAAGTRVSVLAIPGKGLIGLLAAFFAPSDRAGGPNSPDNSPITKREPRPIKMREPA